ncbi:MAG: 3-hydroxybutyryl-CoA dehydrogenase [Acidimicrobiia bacterium]|nr:3-hydroxybutyryl-CoA dehydrogenase [Acidimicrobiia bacterium]
MKSNLNTLAIVGSGIMAGGIADVAASAGHPVIIKARSQSSADGAVSIVSKSLSRRVKKEKITQENADEIAARISTTLSYEDLADVDLVIETVAEDKGIKREVFGELDRICKPEAILATNTSTLPVTELAMATKRPSSVCGIHFFNPANVMELVEIVVPDVCDEDVVEAVTEFVTECGKSPVRVLDRAGFVVNALLFPYLNNAARMAEAGTASREDIDIAMKGGCNFPMGPLALLDLVGLDTSVSILRTLAESFKDPNYEPVPLLCELVEQGHLGRKTGRGLFTYD